MGGPFRPGEQVRIVDGTFAGHEGTTLSLDEVRMVGYRVDHEVMLGRLYWVRLTLFGRNVPVELEAWQSIEPGATGSQECLT